MCLHQLLFVAMDGCRANLIAFSLFVCYLNRVHATLTKVTPKYRTLILDAHNTVRRLAAPNGANMMKMYWDEGLEEKAAIHAERYTNEHDKYYDRYADELPGVATGQNMCFGSGMSWSDCMNMWFDEIDHFKYGVGPTNGDVTLIAHIAQVLYWKTSRVGCARSFCGCVVYFVCNYGYSMIYEDIEKPWNNGGNCSMCPDNCDNGLCDCGGKMCMNDGELNPATCECKCRNAPRSPFYGDACEKLNCRVPDLSWCSQMSPASKDVYCKVYTNTRNDCPHYCNRC